MVITKLKCKTNNKINISIPKTKKYFFKVNLESRLIEFDGFLVSELF